LVKRLKESRIDCMEWRYGETNPAAVVVVSADIAAGWRFLSYATRLQGQGLLRRVVIDECHLTFTASDYRPKLAQLKQLRVLRCPMILLTATLPPVLENELSETMLVRCARYIRAITVRPNIRYMVQWCRGGKLLETATQVCRGQEKTLGAKGLWKGVVYCRGHGQCEELAEMLGCGHYHSGSSPSDKEVRVRIWLDEGGWIVATTALGTGVDYPGIMFVLHVGMPYGMIDYAQESGRAGRAGETADSMILVEDGFTQQKAVSLWTIDESAMVEFIEAEGCRRGVMSGYLDGKETVCRDGDMIHCDRCGEGIAEWHCSQVEVAGEWQKVKMVLDELADGCAACWVTQDGDLRYMHPRQSCSAVAELSKQACDKFRKLIIFERDSHSCMRCGISQGFCATGVSLDRKCQWPDVMVPLVRATMGSDVLSSVILQRVGYTGASLDWVEYGRWLGRRHARRVWGKRMSNAMVVVIRVMLHIGWSQ
jgi:hypothetical protein